ncbi:MULTISPECIES: hypothetical protein [unclassified Spirosoma]|uniref:phage head spike fiber domain-containing protein n=1 Tax=unclassified Spirosoma TaxID=2621999 RepID=UPI000ACE87A0|nr:MULTISPECIES: hypothetical protein [unclassified Spirosoma]MBN8824436.1 hypothetical protein [Spirosoma sp.]
MIKTLAGNVGLFTPSLFLDFTKGSLPSGVTFSRSSVGTYYNSSGVLTAATSNVARIDYDPVTLTCRGILLEESRQNFIVQSSAYTTGSWVKSNCSITANSDVAPDGTTTASLINFFGQNGAYCQQSFGVTTGTTYCFSFYAKGTQIVARTDGAMGGGSGSGIVFNLTNGTFTNASGLYTNVTITNVGSGYYRCSFTKAATSTGTGTFAIDNPNGFYTTVAGSCIIWGAQAEVGSFVTSYIPTTTAAVTRATDYLTINSGTWYSKNESSVFVQYNNLGGGYLFSFGDGQTFQSEILATLNASNILRMQMPNGGGYANVTGNGIQYSPYTFGQVSKAAFGFNAGSICLAYNNTLVTGTATVMPIGNGIVNFYIGRDRNSTANYSGWIQKFIYYPKRLSNAYLQKLTQ